MEKRLDAIEALLKQILTGVIDARQGIHEVSSKQDEIASANRVREDKEKSSTGRTPDIKTYVKNKYIADPNFFREHVTEAEEKAIEGEVSLSAGNKKDDAWKKRMATKIWDKYIKPHKDVEDFYRNMKNVEDKGITSDTPIPEEDDEEEEKAAEPVEPVEPEPAKKTKAPSKAPAKKAASSKAAAPKKTSKAAPKAKAVVSSISDDDFP